VGPVYLAVSPGFLTDGTAGFDFLWGSFDGTTNNPVVYPSALSLSNLLSDVFFQIATNAPPPASVSINTAGNPYSFQFNASGGTPPYTWSLPTNSAALPPGLNLSANGVVSGVPTTTGIYDFIVQVNDSSVMSLTNQRNFSIQVNP
jgi:hypothetical protein